MRRLVSFAVFLCVVSVGAVAGGAGSDLKQAGEVRVARPLVASRASVVYRCTRTSVRRWSAGEVVTTIRYSDRPCGDGELQLVLNVVESVVEHYKPDVSVRGGGVIPNVSPVAVGVLR